MAFSFNAIACLSSLLSSAELEVAGLLLARVVANALRCPTCGTFYSVITPACASSVQLEAAAEELLPLVRRTCGAHPAIIQKQ